MPMGDRYWREGAIALGHANDRSWATGMDTAGPKMGRTLVPFDSGCSLMAYTTGR